MDPEVNGGSKSWVLHSSPIFFDHPVIKALPILDTPANKKNFAGERNIPINTKRPVRISLYPCKEWEYPWN